MSRPAARDISIFNISPFTLFQSKSSHCVSCSGEWSWPEWTDPGGSGVSAQGHTHGWGRGAAGPTPGRCLPSQRSGMFVTRTVHSFNPSSCQHNASCIMTYSIYSPLCMNKCRLWVCAVCAPMLSRVPLIPTVSAVLSSHFPANTTR